MVQSTNNSYRMLNNIHVNNNKSEEAGENKPELQESENASVADSTLSNSTASILGMGQALDIKA